MSHRHYINEVKDELRHVIPASEMLDLLTPKNASPFKKLSWKEKSKKSIFKFCIKTAERLLQQQLFVENHLKELAAIEPRSRALLLSFIKKGYIKSWTIDVISQVKSYIVGVTLELNVFPTKTGESLKMIGANGCGTGYTLNEALIPALAELAERYSLSIFDEKKLVYGSEETLKREGAVSLKTFQFFTDEQRHCSPELHRNNFNKKSNLHWTHALHLNSNTKRLIPAQLVYTFLSYIKPNEPLLFETNSNGTAAHSDKKEAAVRALLEIIERDAFLQHWLKKNPPARIKKETIQFTEIRKLIEAIERQNFNLTILSLHTEFGLPTTAAVISGSRNRSFVFVGAACEFSLEKALKKSLFEVARMAQFYKPASQEDIESAQKKYPFFTTFKERYAWWSLPENKDKIFPFLSGEEIDSQSIVSAFPTGDCATSAEKYSYIREAFINNHFDAYVVDITSKEMRDTGLYIQKAVVPDLIPAYFKEYSLPRALKRLTLPGGHSLQTIPHPFL